MPYNAPPDWLDRNLVLDFFWRFSVFECGLKREGFLHKGRDAAAEPDWQRFGQSIRGRFTELRANGFREAVRTLIAAAPRRQLVRDGHLGWTPLVRREGESEEEFVLRLVRAVRNNLFHGGKYRDGPIDEIARDKAILRAALTVLDGCYELHPGIASWMRRAA
jgi:hypothetical protein